MKAFKQFITNNKEISSLQDNLISYFTANFKPGTIIDEQLLSNVVLKAGSNKVEHKLGKMLTDYRLGSQNANSQIWYTAKDEKYLTLSATADVTINLWVF